MATYKFSWRKDSSSSAAVKAVHPSDDRPSSRKASGVKHSSSHGSCVLVRQTTTWDRFELDRRKPLLPGGQHRAGAGIQTGMSLCPWWFPAQLGKVVAGLLYCFEQQVGVEIPPANPPFHDTVILQNHTGFRGRLYEIPGQFKPPFS